jgi:IMP and pyridine-specific 5'-nucleotidase
MLLPRPAGSLSNLDSGIADVAYWDLLSNPDVDDSISRAKSASDAAVLRRKGHLKEQDRLIEFMREMHDTHTCEEVMLKMERWVQVGAAWQLCDALQLLSSILMTAVPCC